MKSKLILTFLVVSMSIMGQSNTKLPPRWLGEPPLPQNDSFVYRIHSSKASDLNTARTMCLQDLVSESGLSNGAVVISDNNMNMNVLQSVENGCIIETSMVKGDFNTSVKTEEVSLCVNKIDEYWTQGENGEYNVYVLYARSKPNQDPYFDDVYVNDFYGFEAGWRSAVVPGWGQFHKGDYKKGAMMLGGTLALAGSVVLTEATRADYEQKYGLTHDVSARKEYLNRHNHWQLARNICVGALAGFYIYNIVDAFNAPGARYVVVRLADNDGRTYNFAPSVSPEGYPMAMATITF